MSDGQSSPGPCPEQERLKRAMEYTSACRDNLETAISLNHMISADTDGVKEMVESTITCFNESVKMASEAAKAVFPE